MLRTVAMLSVAAVYGAILLADGLAAPPLPAIRLADNETESAAAGEAVPVSLEQDEETPGAEDEGDTSQGRADFNANCLQCHDAERSLQAKSASAWLSTVRRMAERKAPTFLRPAGRGSPNIWPNKGAERQERPAARGRGVAVVDQFDDFADLPRGSGNIQDRGLLFGCLGGGFISAEGHRERPRDGVHQLSQRKQRRLPEPT